MGEDGKPMHKTQANFVAFDEAAERVGSDTMRWLFANHTPEQNLNFPRIPRWRTWISRPHRSAGALERQMDAGAPHAG